MYAYFYTHDRNFTWINLHVLMWHQKKKKKTEGILHLRSLHLQYLFILQRLAFITRHQFFPAYPPFVNTVYYKFNLLFFCFFKISNEVAI